MKIPRLEYYLCLAVLFAAFGNVGCALRVKVKEDWDHSLNQEIPLDEVADTWQVIRRGKMPAPEDLEAYNLAVRNSVIQIGANWAAGDRPLAVIKTPSGNVKLDVKADEVLSHQAIDQVVPADFVRVKRGFMSEAVVDGVGASLLVRQPKTEENSMIPESGLWFPVTSILNMDRPDQPVLEIIDPTRQAELQFGSARVPLAANYTASFARDFYDRQRLFPDLPAFIAYEKYVDKMGLHRLSAFDPDKQVCILIHGIYSSPSTWEVTVNEFYSDRELREKFEFWTFGYPTGALVPHMAAELREAIAEMREFRAREGARDQSLVIVGHSMGGLVAKAVTQSGGDEDWNKLFKVPIDELNVSSEYRETLRRVIYYEPVPNVEKVIFCATPHRGSRAAANPGGKLVANIVQMPAQLAQAGAEILNDGERTLTPLGLEVARGNLTSMGLLRPNSIIANGLMSKPLNPSVRYISVIGTKGKKGQPLEEVSDGLVDYSSSHIEGVETEIIVYDMPHGVHRTPEGAAAIMEVLKTP